uniref:hypothetical protein n=1 Tax=Amycolatopsis sp. CA-082387 TaxID=3239918 RepID=UPI003F49B286
MKLVSAVQKGFPVLSDADAALLVAAHLDLREAQAEGVQLFGSTAGFELVAAAHGQLNERFADAAAALLEVAA